MRDVKLKNISLLLIGAALVVATAACLAAPLGPAHAAITPVAGPTAYVPGVVQTRNVSTPMPAAPAPSVTAVPVASGVPAPSVTVVPAATAQPTAAAVAGGATSAQILNYGTDSDTFKRGERATGFITVKNTGGTVINDVTTSVSADVKLPVIGATSVGTKDYTFNNLNIKPGETKRIEFAVDIPSEYKGVSTAGDYDLHVAVKAGGTDIGSFSKSVKVT